MKAPPPDVAGVLGHTPGMPLSIGGPRSGPGPSQTQPDDPRALLLECHGRIRQFAALARSLAAAGPGTPPEQVAGAAGQVRRYFAEALPLHMADEDQSIAPRIRGRDPALDAALADMSAEHAHHQAQIDQLCELCGELEARPAALAELAPVLAPLSAALEAELAEHLRREEDRVLPQLARLLTAGERAAITGEMRGRRRPREPDSGAAAT